MVHSGWAKRIPENVQSRPNVSDSFYTTSGFPKLQCTMCSQRSQRASQCTRVRGGGSAIHIGCGMQHVSCWLLTLAWLPR